MWSVGDQMIVEDEEDDPEHNVGAGKNNEGGGPGKKLKAGDVVGVIPPVSGG